MGGSSKHLLAGRAPVSGRGRYASFKFFVVCHRREWSVEAKYYVMHAAGDPRPRRSASVLRAQRLSTQNDSECVLRTAGIAVLLNGWAWNRAIRAEHTAITHCWFQDRSTTLAFIEPLAGICRHGFDFFVTAFRTGQRRLKNDFRTHWEFLLDPCVACDSPGGVFALLSTLQARCTDRPIVQVSRA